MRLSSTRHGRLAGALALLAISVLAQRPAAAQSVPDYLLSAGDKLEIAVWKEPDLTKEFIVRPDGKFSFPLAGELTAAGRTVSQIQQEITAKLKPYIPDPVVTATVTDIEGNRVYVIGQVAKAGSFVMNPRINVLQALSLAGGMTPFASVNDIIVLRGAGGAQRALQFHYGDVAKGKNLTQNVMLEAGDVVIVP